MLSNTVLQRTEEQMQEHGEDTRILFLGDSHPKYAINPKYIQDSFNYSSSGENYFQSFLKFKNITDKELMDLDSLVIPLDFHSFSSYRAERFLNEWYWKDFEGFDEWPEFKGVKNTVRKIAAARYPVIDNGGEFIKYFIKRPELAELEKGWQRGVGDYSLAKNKEVIVKKRFDEQFKDSNYINDFLFEYFLRIIDLAKEENIKVVLLKYPITEDYYFKFDKEMGSEESFYGQFEERLKDKDVRILDFQKMYFDRPHYFFNADHLNETGAIDFSKLLNDELYKNEIAYTNTTSK